MADATENKVKIAVIEEQIRGIREQAATHAKDTRERFDTMDEKLDLVVAALNKGKGAYAVLILISGTIGAIFIKVVGLVIQWFRL